MNKNEYKIMADFEKNYWWHSGKKSLVKIIIDKYFQKDAKLNILEIGCGTGEICKVLGKYGKVLGIDISREALDIAKTNGFENTILGNINQLDISKWRKSFDLVIALDVLEHIQDDLDTMKRVHEMLKPNGIFFINVPAHKFLWSEHDEALHHKRRYHSLEITKKLRDTDFSILKKSYFVFVPFPIIAFYRIWGNFFGKSAYPKTSYVKLPEKLNELMTKILHVESMLIRYLNFPIGTTITVIAKPINNEQ